MEVINRTIALSDSEFDLVCIGLETLVEESAKYYAKKDDREGFFLMNETELELIRSFMWIGNTLCTYGEGFKQYTSVEEWSEALFNKAKDELDS